MTRRELFGAADLSRTGRIAAASYAAQPEDRGSVVAGEVDATGRLLRRSGACYNQWEAPAWDFNALSQL
jgi:hypothetical protein